MALLNKGLMYNIPSFNKNFMIREIICAEAAIKTIDNISHQEETRAIINSKINKVIKKDSHITNLQNKYKRDVRIARNVYENFDMITLSSRKLIRATRLLLLTKIHIPIKYKNS